MNGERLLMNEQKVDKTITSSIITPGFLMLKHIYGGVIEDNCNYTYPIKELTRE